MTYLTVFTLCKLPMRKNLLLKRTFKLLLDKKNSEHV